MKKLRTLTLAKLAFAGLLGALTLQSCADDPVTPSETTKITFTENAQATYTHTRLDSAESNRNHPMTEGADTVIQTTTSANASYAGKTGVAIKTSHYVISGARDTSYFWQDASDDLYIYNFGLELVNGPEAQALLNQRIDAGWVLAANMKASANSTWLAVDTSVSLINLGISAAVKDQVTANGTVPLVIEGKTVQTKKFTHVVTATLPFIGEAARAEIEVYVAPEYGGIVRQVRKSAKYVLSGSTSWAIGADMQLVSYVK